MPETVLKNRVKRLPLLLFFLCAALGADDMPPGGALPRAENPFDKLIFKAAVFGPSDEIFIWWGHAALIVDDPDGYARIFDWGIFSYPGDSFPKAFALNQIRYKSGVAAARWDIESYIKEDRDIMLYTLDIEAAEKEAILRYAENNVLPENCWYLYHQFKDNCSTRIRDLVDMGTGGQFQNTFKPAAGRFTLREHMRRFSWYRPCLDWFLGFLLGRDIDQNTTVWEEMYLPVELARNIVNFSYTDSAGTERKLVSRVEVINRAQNRKPVLAAPRGQWPRALAAGLAAAALLALIKWFRGKFPRAGRAVWGISQSLLALVLGLAGLVLFAASRVPERDYMRHNINLLFVNPLLLAAIPLGIYTALGKKRAAGTFSVSGEKCLRVLWLYVCAAGVVAGLLNALPFLYQHNISVLTLVIPPALVSALPEFRGLRGFRFRRQNIEHTKLLTDNEA